MDPLWTVTAAYPADGHDSEVHPLVHMYPAPMALACADHLSHMLAQDMMHFGSTGSWLVKPTTSQYVVGDVRGPMSGDESDRC